MFLADKIAKNLVSKKLKAFNELRQELKDMQHKNIKLDILNDFKK